MPEIERRTALNAVSPATLALAPPGNVFARTGSSPDASRPGLPLKSIRLVPEYQMEVRA